MSNVHKQLWPRRVSWLVVLNEAAATARPHRRLHPLYERDTKQRVASLKLPSVMMPYEHLLYELRDTVRDFPP